MVHLKMKAQKTEAQKGEVICPKAHSKFMAELELEPQLFCPPHRRMPALFQMAEPLHLSHALLFPPQLTTLLLYPGDKPPLGKCPGTDTWSRSPLQDSRGSEKGVINLQPFPVHLCQSPLLPVPP